MANIDNPNGFTLVRTQTGHEELVEVTLESGQAIKKGDALILNRAAGTVRIALATSLEIYGVAAEDKGSSDSRALKMHPATPWNIFSAQTEGSYAVEQHGIVCDIFGTTGNMEVDEDAAATQVFQILGADPNTETGANGRVRGIFVRSSYHATGLSNLPIGTKTLAITTNTTLAAQHSGQWLLVTAGTDVTITLPAGTTSTSFCMNIMSALPNNAIVLNVSPTASTDKIYGAGWTGTDDKDIILTKATSQPGDYVKLIGDADNGWLITELVGVWAYEA